MKLFTSLPESRGWNHVPCPAPPSLDVGHVPPMVVIDHETDNGPLEDGDPAAIRRALDILQTYRTALPGTKLGFYGFPTCRQPHHVDPFAATFRPILNCCDFVAPCCYVSGDGLAWNRAIQVRTCITRMELGPKPTYAFVSECPVNEVRICTDAEIAEQVQAAKAVGADGIYLWSGISHNVWAAQLNPPPSHPAFMPVQEARSNLLGVWVFCINNWLDALSVHREHVRISNGIKRRFAEAIVRATGVARKKRTTRRRGAGEENRSAEQPAGGLA